MTVLGNAFPKEWGWFFLLLVTRIFISKVGFYLSVYEHCRWQEGYTFNPREDDVDRIEYPNGAETGVYYRIELDREPIDLILVYNPDGSKRS